MAIVEYPHLDVSQEGGGANQLAQVGLAYDWLHKRQGLTRHRFGVRPEVLLLLLLHVSLNQR
jgi:hypothetical protein